MGSPGAMAIIVELGDGNISKRPMPQCTSSQPLDLRPLTLLVLEKASSFFLFQSNSLLLLDECQVCQFMGVVCIREENLIIGWPIHYTSSHYKFITLDYLLVYTNANMWVCGIVHTNVALVDHLLMGLYRQSKKQSASLKQ